MNELKQQLELLLIAVGFFTRLPVPNTLEFSRQKLNRAGRYFSSVGWLVGSVCALAYWLLSQFLPIDIAILGSMLVSVVLTGCFHEDGLADTCDGFAGGWQKQQKLTIMKDSRLGTYGAVAIWMVLMLKYMALIQIEAVITSLLVAHVLSRALATSLIVTMPYVGDPETAKVKPLAELLTVGELGFNFLIAAFSLFLVIDISWLLLIVLLTVYCILRTLYFKQIGGFTGDTLGAAQQISEVVVYLVIVSSSFGVAI
ncbi:MAG: adenosylcobinamide-GDP ribazoletransferase [Gammaproteobacteria bacterium]|nr:MAG: adenosylcobinamide-GDP ribazoletransferase [Gammaproteobacteria bacterium]